MKILSSADWHINLHKKKIPYAWAERRFLLLFEKLRELEKQCDVHVISGDLFDKKPEPDETCLLLSYLNSVTIPTIVIPGNHEATSKGRSFWEHFKLENTIKNSNVYILTDNSRVEILNQGFQAFPYGSVQTDNLPAYTEGDILITHIRGEVPPHITEEYDFEKLRAWKLILLGDLHFNHSYKDFPAFYPGSPLNTTFDRDDKRQYGVDIIDFRSISDYDVAFVDLKLPKLIRKTVSVDAELVKDNVNHVVYEVQGSIDQLAKIQKSDLLDKKLAVKDSGDSTLDLKNKSIHEELELYLKHIKISNVEAVVNTFKNTIGTNI
jgi:DNA repair exonuclease SbcCD nuclease subunit